MSIKKVEITTEEVTYIIETKLYRIKLNTAELLELKAELEKIKLEHE